MATISISQKTSDYDWGGDDGNLNFNFGAPNKSNASGFTITVTGQDGSTHVLSGTISNNGSNWSMALTPAQAVAQGLPLGFAIDKWSVAYSADGDTGFREFNVDETIECFYAGTMIATPAGEVAVETLAIGDMVLRHDGSAVPVRWMGRHTVMPMFADKLKTLPIRIRKGALAENVPSRDLLVSPGHAILVDGVLAHASALVNGTSIVRETNVPSKFSYYHVELAEHALIVAENTPAESFVDNVDRESFDNWAEHEALYGDLKEIVEMDLPRARSVRQVASVTRERLAARAVELGYSVADAAVA